MYLKLVKQFLWRAVYRDARLSKCINMYEYKYISGKVYFVPVLNCDNEVEM